MAGIYMDHIDGGRMEVDCGGLFYVDFWRLILRRLWR